MSHHSRQKRDRLFLFAGLGVALVLAVFLSPFASHNPDGLDRVSQDLKFDHKAAETGAADKLPFAAIFQEYAVRGVPQQVATPLAGLVGTLATFALAWGLGKLAVRHSRGHSSPDAESSD
jgi:cobalt/nickel transport protein